MIVATVIQNPIDPINSRKIIHLAPGTTYLEAVDILFPAALPARNIDLGMDICFAVDGHLVAPGDTDIIPDGVSLVSCLVPHGGGGGVGKTILRAVSLIVLAVISYGVGAAIGASAWAASTAASVGMGVTAAGIGTAAGAAVMMAGSMLVNAVLPMGVAQSSMENSLSQSSTYSWDLQGNKFQESTILPELYGTHRIKPPIIGLYVESDGDNQVLNLLFAVSKWQIDTITDIKINNTDIADYNLPPPVMRMGTNEQEVVPAFNDTHHNVYFNTVLPRDVDPAARWVNKTTAGSLNTGIGVGLSFPQGLCKYEGGGAVYTVVTLDIQYSVHGADSWTALSETLAIPASVAANRWSGGYWDQTENGMPIWKELEAGSTVFTDHVDGDPYAADPATWIIPGYSGQDYIIPNCIWHWVVDGQTIIQESAVTNAFVTISATKTSAFHRAWYKKGLAPGSYDIRVRFHDLPPAMGDNNGFVNAVYWEFYDEIIEESFSYPCTCVLGISALATSKLSGSMPTVDMVASRLSVWVWDPYMAQYTLKSASNPAWICYDMLHKCRQLANLNNSNIYEHVVFGIPYVRIDYYAFKAWADWCDLVEGNKVAYVCDIYFDAPYNLRRALDMVGLCGRGSVHQIGSTFTCTVEKTESTPVQRFLFNSANIEQDSFQVAFIPLTDRANMVEVTYRDEDDDYAAKIVEVHTADFDTTTDEVRKSSIDLIGCTNRVMAGNFGKYLLNCNRYLTTTASWKSDIDALACFPGDIVEVQHDVPQWGYGGRLIAGCTTTSLKLDQPVTIESGKTYHVIVNHQDDDTREEVAVSTGAGTVSTLTVAALTKAPAEDARYSFGEINQVAKLMRIVRITRDSELKRNVTAVEFVNEVFNDSTNIPAYPFGYLKKTIVPPPLAAVAMELAWVLDNQKKEWAPVVRITFVFDTAVDYRNLPIPVSKIRVYAHVEDGDVHTSPMIGTYEYVADMNPSAYDIPAAPMHGKTIFVTAEIINAQGMMSAKCDQTVFYVNTGFTPAPSTSNLSINAYDYENNGIDGYNVFFSWIPYGWELDAGKYKPILEWNGGSNYYVFEKYMIVYGFVAAQNNIPDPEDMFFFETPDIGNIFAADGTMITDVDDLDAICRAAASAGVGLRYSQKWVAIAVYPVMKNGIAAGLDYTQADYGVDWEWIRVTLPGGTGSTVEDVEIQNAELVYTVQPGMAALSEMNWDYTLTSPVIDGFAVITRIQPYQWAWPLNAGITIGQTNLVNIVSAINYMLGGGEASFLDISDRYLEWYAGGVPYFYLMLSSPTAYEVIKVDTQTLVVTRGVEGTTARAWASGDWVSYSPCEIIDSVSVLTDTTQRHYVWSPPVQVNFSLHATLVAYKLTASAPGYKRSHYAYWDYVRSR